MNYFLGCDPGESGAFAIIKSDYTVEIIEDFSTFSRFFEVLTTYKERLSFAIIELVFIFPGSRASASTTFMKNTGALEAFCEILNIKRDLVPPQKWQKAILGSITRPNTKELEKKEKNKILTAHRKSIKQLSINKANLRFGLNLTSNDDGKADALNMALYGLKYFNNEAL